MYEDDLVWKKQLLASFRDQGKATQQFSSVIRAQLGLRAKIANMRQYTKSMENQLGDLKRNRGNVPGSPSPGDQPRIQRLQEELTESYKRNSEDATAMLSLTNQIQKVQRTLIEKEEIIEKQNLELERLQTLLAMREREIKSTQTNYETIKRELDASQNAFRIVEKQRSALDSDYKELLNRWIIKAEEDAKKMNLANELYSDMVSMKRKEQMLQKGSEEGKKIIIERGVSAICLSSLPKESRASFSGHKGEINYCNFNHSGSLLATGGSDRTICLWDTNSLSRQAILPGSGQSIMCVNFSHGDDFVLGSSNDNTIRVWKVETQRLQYTLTGHIGKVYTAEFTGDGERIISGSHDRTLKLWDIERGGKCQRTIFCNSSCNDLCLPLEGSMICSVHLDSNIRLWDPRTADKATDILENIHSKQVTSVSLAPDGKTILTCSRDNTLKVVDLKMNQVLQTFQHPTFRTETNWNRACFSPDGTMAVGGSSSGSIYIWDVLNGSLKTTLDDKHSRAVNCAAWSVEGNVVTCDRGGIVALWK